MKTTEEAYGRLYEIMKTLRSPEGCPWDREQTPRSIRGNMIEESYELVEAIDSGDVPHVREELGDVFLVATMMAYMYEQEGAFTVADVLAEVGDKLVRRHPHVFGESTATTSDEVLAQWADIKENLEGRRKKDSLLDSVSRALPPLERAYKVQKKAAKVGFDWTHIDEVWEKVGEELEEAREACVQREEALAATKGRAKGHAKVDPDEPATGDSHFDLRLEEELGDLLFSVINVSRFLGVDPSVALHRTVEKFGQRFRFVERHMTAEGKSLTSAQVVRMNELWELAKKED